MPNTTVYLKDYQPPVFNVEAVSLHIDLYDDHALVQSKLQLQRQHEGALYLLGDELELVHIALNGKSLTPDQYQLTAEQLILADCPAQFVLDITTRIKPQDNTQLSGLYRSNHLFCTQCEAEGFRRITYFPDRPDVLATYTTYLSADKNKYPVLLSNGNLVAQGDMDNGRHWVQWHDPFKKPSYLFAVVAGDLAWVSDTFITASGRSVALRIYVEPGNEDKCAHAMSSLKKAMLWDEAVYGREYDLDLFMIVAVSDFNMGAMENKGLNIFNSKYILARPDTATDQDFAAIESVVAHEYFHNWTGNRVTCRDWFQLSLKEGLTVFRDQEFSRDMNSREVNRISDVQVLRKTQFPEDASSMAHAVRPESYQEINNFYTATIYNKGAEVIRMQHTLLGVDGFRKGTDLYFQRHDGQAVTIDDFVAAMEEANGVDLTQFKRWYSQAGTPQVKVSQHFVDGTLTLTMAQHTLPTPECQEKQPFHIPIKVALFNEHGELLPLEQDVLQLKETHQDFVFNGLAKKPIVSLLREFSAPIQLEMPRDEAEYLFLLQHETDGFAKWDAGQSLIIHHLHRALQANERHEISFPESLFHAFQAILSDNRLDLEFCAQLITPPSFEEVIATLTFVEVDLVERVRDQWRQQLGRKLFHDALSIYEHLWQQEDHQMNGQAYGRRALRALCLLLMMKGNEKEAMGLCLRQFKQAQTMTDQMAAFSLLINCSDEAVRAETIADFYQQWAHDDLVLDKWFSLQAMSEHPDTLKQVDMLMQHTAFSLTNPNKVRAVVGAFCQANPRHFHHKNGSGYAFLTQMLLRLDAINPQIAARLAAPFTRWQRYDDLRQQLMQDQLQILSQASLSRDLAEVVSKSLP
ncbi:MAG: aminopeptidase N [Legionella sp.]|nr:MAG: aminopeptidase N [Legionella sp.]PJD97768.1 MAG: aminopeptidase N [Legionella sp.]